MEGEWEGQDTMILVMEDLTVIFVSCSTAKFAVALF